MSNNVIVFDNKKHDYFELSNYYPISFKAIVKNNLNNNDELLTFNSVE